MKKLESISFSKKQLSKADMKKVKGGVGTGLWVCVADYYDCYLYKGQCYTYCSKPSSCRFYGECP